MNRSLLLLAALLLVALFAFSQGEIQNPNTGGGIFWRTTGNNNTNSGTNFIGTADNVSWRIRTNNIPRAVIDSNGLVGIGIGTPTKLLHTASGDLLVAGTITNTTGIEIIPAKVALQGGGRLFFREVANDLFGASIGYNGGNAGNEILNWPSNTFNIALHDNNTNGTPIITIERLSLNMGVGTTAPLRKLHLGGSTNGFRYDGVASGGGFISAPAATTDKLMFADANGDLRAMANGSSNQVLSISAGGAPAWSNSTAWIITGNNNTNSGTHFIGTSNNVSLRFRTNNAERMVIDSNGRVGIGITNPADAVLQVNGTPWRKINFSSTGTASMGRLGLDGAGSTFSTNAYWSGTAWVRDDVAEPSFALIEHTSNSRYEFRVATPNTGNIAWTTAMVVNTAANVGIGTTAPTQRLHIVGSVRIVDGTQADNYVLKSDANGNASWADPATLLTDSTDWTITGNSGTVDGTNFIGTTDNIPFTVRVNNQTAGRINHLQSSASWGYRALRSITTGYENTAVGDSALSLTTTGYRNTAMGYVALVSNTTGHGNTAVGTHAMQRNTTGERNASFGYQPLAFNTSGDYNVGVGYRALYDNTIGGNNVAIGREAMYNNIDGSYNIAIGGVALTSNDEGQYNTAVGYNALSSNQHGTYNTALGHNSGINGAAFNSYATAIGANAQVSDAYCLVLGAITGVNSYINPSTKVGIGVTNPSFPLHVVGSRIQGNIYHYFYGGSGSGNTTSTLDVSIRASHAMLADKYCAVSDARVKNVVAHSNAAADLNVVNRLNVVDYKYKDSIGQSASLMKGFLAQEVEQLMPEAVSTVKNFIPDIYTLSTEVTKGTYAHSMIIRLPVKHNLQEEDRVKIITRAQHDLMVECIDDEYTFEVCNYTEPFTDKIFVYGKEVSDFRTVDYDRIFVTGISAIQELNRQLAQERETNAIQAEQLKLKANADQVNLLRNEMEELKSLLLRYTLQSKQ